MFDADNYLFLVSPVGFEEKTTILVAKDSADAERQAKMIPNVSEVISMYGAGLKVLNVTENFKKQGWNIYLAKEGMYH